MIYYYYFIINVSCNKAFSNPYKYMEPIEVLLITHILCRNYFLKANFVFFFRLLATNLQTASYEFVYKKMVDDDYSFELSSPSVWCATFLGVDLAYYWFHRAAHGTILLHITPFGFKVLQ